jgi:LPXTG-motif cell wall-anchored protein
VSQTYSELPAGTECTVVETQDGKNTTTAVDVQGRLREVTVPAGGTATAQITDTYTPRPGALVVRKTITGEASPLRGPITIEVECDDAVTRDPFVIPAAGARSGEEIRIYSEIPAGTTCTVTETEDGNTRAATVTVQGSGQDLSIPAAGAVVADLTNTYDFAPGSLVIRKRINGPLAGQQGDITLRPVCDGVELPPFTIPAGTPPGTLSRAYTDIPAGAQCTGTEAPNGANAVAVPRITVTRALPVRILPGAATTGTVTNTYTAAAVALRVSKTIRGERAGDQGEIVISTRCGDTTLPDLVIPAGASAGTTTRTYDGMTPSEQCTIRETADGRTTELEVRATGSPQDVTVPVIGTQTAYLTNAYEDVAASGPSGAANTDSPLLPNTGAPANATWLLPIGAVSVCVGMLMLAMSRRRQN